MKHHITLSDWEALNFDNIKIPVRPIEQPHQGYELDNIKNGFIVYRMSYGHGSLLRSYPIPYTTELWCQEAWRILNKEIRNIDCDFILFPEEYYLIEYKDGCKKWIQCELNLRVKNKWRSPITMPKLFSRRTIKVEFGVKRIQNITSNEAYLMGYPNKKPTPEFIDWWNDHYPQHKWEVNPYVLLLKRK